MSSTLPSVINMVNTAFGVTVLAVPYCFHQCGIILGCILLTIASYASKRSCCLLLRSAQLSRKRDFESLGFHVAGFLGKFVVELSLIGYLVGTCIAWFVVIGDVAPAVLSSLLGIEKSWVLRMLLIVIIGFGAVLPLSLVKDITSLSSASNVAIGIYSFFVVQLFLSTLPKILSWEWVDVVNFWKPGGMLQCLPIFVISFLSQTVLFVIYDALPEPSVKKMENVVSSAMDILLFLSVTVGFCGYVMFCTDGIQGDLLNNYQHDFMSEFIRLGFCISTVLSFPLLIFPCRVSINSMISSAKASVEGASNEGGFIPHERFFVITCSLVVGSLIFGILFPSVEFVMALVGATMGALLAYILPSYVFVNISQDEASKTEAKVLLVLGLSLFCLSTFTVLSMSESHSAALSEIKPVNSIPVPTKMLANGSLVAQAGQTKEELQDPVRPNLGGSLGKSHVNPKHFPKARTQKTDESKAKGVVDELSKENTAGVSRKEPVAPQERILMSLPGVKKVVAPTIRNGDAGTNDRDKREDLRKDLRSLVKRSANVKDVEIVEPPLSNTNVSLSSVLDKKKSIDGDSEMLDKEEDKGDGADGDRHTTTVSSVTGEPSTVESVKKHEETDNNSRESLDNKSRLTVNNLFKSPLVPQTRPTVSVRREI